MSSNSLCAGQASLLCASISIGGLSTLDEPLSAVVVQSPSSHCNRLLATADLHAAASRVQTKPAKTPKSFLVVKFGRGSANTENSASRRSDKEALLWEMRQPSGMKVDVEAAGIEVKVSVKYICGMSCSSSVNSHNCQPHLPDFLIPALPCALRRLHQHCKVLVTQVAKMPVLGWLCCA